MPGPNIYPVLWLSPAEPGPFITLLVLIGLATGAGYLSFWAMMPDTVEYGEWRSGIRAEGAIFGLVSLIQKAALGLAAAGLGELLGRIGYTPGAAQSESTLSGVKTILVAGPAACSVFALAFIAIYPLDPRTHRRLVKILAGNHRRSKRS